MVAFSLGSLLNAIQSLEVTTCIHYRNNGTQVHVQVLVLLVHCTLLVKIRDSQREKQPDNSIKVYAYLSYYLGNVVAIGGPFINWGGGAPPSKIFFKKSYRNAIEISNIKNF